MDNGAMFIFLNTTVDMEFGIDLKIWQIGSNFRGIKMIPPGPHYIYYNHTIDPDEVVMRKGFMHYFKEKELVIRKWNPESKNISFTEIPESEYERCKSNIEEIRRYLGCYPAEMWNKWKCLSKHITENLITQLTPKCSYIQAVVDTVLSPKKEKSRRWIKARTDVERHEDLLPNLVPVEGTEIRFTEIPEERFPEGSTPSEITSHYLDATYILQKMIDSYKHPLEFIGEIQFAFATMLIGLNYDSFERWKYLVQLVCSCEKAVIEHTNLYSEFITCLSAQMDETPLDFLADIVTNNNVIYSSLKDLFRTVLSILDSSVNPRLRSKILKFKSQLTEKFGWDFNNLEYESGDEAPVIVSNEINDIPIEE